MKAIAGIMVAALLAAGTATAQTSLPSPQQLDEKAQIALQWLQRAMIVVRMVFDGLPSYETPEILPNGDILIRRKPSTAGKPV